MNIKDAPIMNFFHLTLNPDEREQFLKAGEKNLLTSINDEDGVYFMALAADKKDSDYVFEVYKDQTSYQNHIDSPQFKAYQEVARTAVDETDSFNLTPQFIGTNYQDLRIKEKNNYRINLAKITLVDADLADFGKIVKEEMTRSIEEEPGVVAMLAGNMFDIENEWRFFEIYQDDAAYQSHVRTENFIKYVEKTKEMIYQKDILELHGEIIVDHANMNFKA